VDTITRADVEGLISVRQWPSASIYLATNRPAVEPRREMIELKNLANSAEETMVRQGCRPVEARHILRPVRDLLTDSMFWSGRADGVAVFAAHDTFRYWRLPAGFTSHMSVSRRFCIKPLLPLIESGGRIYVLTVSKKRTGMLLAGEDGLHKVEVAGLPTDRVEALNYDQPQTISQTHTADPGKPGKQSAVFYGQGGAPDDAQQETVAYFREIDRVVAPYLRQQGSPVLVFVGVEQLFPIYQRVNSYARLHDKAILGSPGAWTTTELHAKVLELARPIWNAGWDSAFERVRRTDDPFVSTDVGQIVRAALGRRIDRLFVAADRTYWGTYDPETDKVDDCGADDAGSEDLLDLAAALTVLGGGRVRVLPVEQMPGGCLAAATMRYELHAHASPVRDGGRGE
jgi:hypothetical protein